MELIKDRDSLTSISIQNNVSISFDASSLRKEQLIYIS